MTYKNKYKNLTPEILSIIRIISGMAPTLLAYKIFNGEPDTIITFIKIATLFSLTAAFSTLGLGSLAYACYIDPEKHKKKIELINSLTLISSILTTIIFCIIFFITKEQYYIFISSVTFFSAISAIQLQKGMATKEYMKIFFAGNFAPFLFLIIIVGFKVFGIGKTLFLLSIVIYLSTTIAIIPLIKAVAATKATRNILTKETNIQILNGLICSIGPSIVTLCILSAGSNLENTEKFTAYLFYVKLFEGAASFFNSVFLIKYFKSIKNPWTFFTLSSVKLGIILFTFLFIITNFTTHLILKETLLQTSILEGIIFFLKFLISSLSLFLIANQPHILTKKELLIVLSFLIMPCLHFNNVTQIQIFSIVIYSAILLILTNKMKKHQTINNI